VTVSCEYGDEPAGSGAIELVIRLFRITGKKDCGLN
jgi:hypothetical protein